MWLRNTTLTQSDDSACTIGVANLFIQEWVERRYKSLIEEAFKEECGEAVAVSFRIDPDLYHSHRAKERAEGVTLLRTRSQPQTPPSIPAHTMASFVVTDSNVLAYKAAEHVIRVPGDSYNPLFIHGASGVGKTHLLRGIAHALRKKNPNKRVHFLSGESFTNRFVQAIRRGDPDGFRNRLRRVDVLLIDDIDFLANKGSTQAELQHTFDTLINAGRQVVLSSDAHPRTLRAVREGLVTRFVSGLVVRIDSPDFPARMKILRAKSVAAGLSLDASVLSYVAKTATGSVRELEGALNGLRAWNVLAGGGRITMHTAKQALAPFMQSVACVVSAKAIEDVVCRVYGLTPSELRSKTRARRILIPRQIAMYLARELTDMSFQDIAAFFGGMNHATAIAAHRKIRDNLDREDPLRRTLGQLHKMLSRE